MQNDAEITLDFGREVEIEGQFRSYNSYENEKKTVYYFYILYVDVISVSKLCKRG